MSDLSGDILAGTDQSELLDKGGHVRLFDIGFPHLDHLGAPIVADKGVADGDFVGAGFGLVLDRAIIGRGGHKTFIDIISVRVRNLNGGFGFGGGFGICFGLGLGFSFGCGSGFLFGGIGRGFTLGGRLGATASGQS